MTKVIIVRHCQAEGNLKRFFQGSIDTDITELGERQIESVAKLLADKPIEVMYSSPKKRAMKTAEGINRYHELPIQIDAEIVEIDAGDWEGVLLTDIEKIYPEQMDNWRNHPGNFHAPNGESMAEVYERVKKALLRIVSENRNKTICVVSHGCAIRNMMCFAYGFEVGDIDKVPLGTNTSVNVVEFDDDLQPSVAVGNDTEHIPLS